MDLLKTPTYWIMSVSIRELKQRISRDEALFINREPFWSTNRDKASIMEADEFIFAATGQWDIEQANDPMMLFYPHVCVHLEKEIIPESFENGTQICDKGNTWALFTQACLSEPELFAFGCLPSDFYIGFDQVYVKPVGINLKDEERRYALLSA